MNRERLFLLIQIVVTLLFILLLAIGCTKTTQTPIASKTFSEKDYGIDKWPFTIDEGQVECWGNGVVTFRTSKGTYALNGYTSDKYGFTNIKKSTFIKSSHIIEGVVFSQDFVNLVDDGIGFCANSR